VNSSRLRLRFAGGGDWQFSHGAYKFKGEQHLDLERLKAIKKALLDAGMGDYPLVLHGASSVPKDLADEINKYGGKMGTTPRACRKRTSKSRAASVARR
jgi:hypothetical protein